MTTVDQMERLRWRCRRGTRELDTLVSQYLEKCYGCASAAHRQAFEDLLALDDPQLYELVTGRTRLEEGAHRDVVRAIVQDIGYTP